MESLKREHIIEIAKKKKECGRYIEIFDTSLNGNKYELNLIKID